MRISNSYLGSTIGRNDGAPLYYTNIMRKLGHDVVRPCGLKPIEPLGKCDFHLWVDWGEDALKPMLPNEPINMSSYHPSVYIASDTHLGFDYRLNKAKEFDFVFCNQKRAVEEFGKNGVKSTWLPHAAEPMAYPCIPECMKKYDVSFVGYVSFPKRRDALDRIFKSFDNFFYGQRLFESAAEMYRKSKIVLNTAAVDDVNMRVFETLATKSFLLTEDIPTIHELFTDGKHLVTYKNLDDAIDKIKYYLQNDEERNNIALEGYKEFISKHTYQHRFETILKSINL